MESHKHIEYQEKCIVTDDKNTKGHTFWQWFIAISVNLNMVTLGMQTGWVSPMMKTLQSERSPVGHAVTDGEISWIGSVLSLAAAAAVLPYSYCVDRFGRKFCIYAITVPQALAWIIKLFATSTAAILIARACCGVAAGGCFVVIPMYVKEISQDNIRGLLGSLLIMFQNIGILAIYGLGAYWDYHTVLWVVSVVPIISTVLLLKAPESPAYLMKAGRIEELLSTIAFLRGLDIEDSRVKREVETMKKEEESFMSMPAVSILNILKNRAWRRSFILMLCIFFVTSSCGSTAVITYASSVLSSFGTSVNSEITSLSFPFLMILAAFASMSCVERYGRKVVLAISLALLMSSMATIGIVMQLQSQGIQAPAWMPLAAIMANVTAYAFGLCPVPYIMMSEMFNFLIRAKIMGITVTYSWLLTFIQLLVYTPLCQTVGLHGAFYTFATINGLGLILTICFFPETKGKSVEQIEIEMRGK